MNDRIMLDPPPRAADGYAQGCAWCVIGAGMLVAAIIGILAGGV